MQVKPTYTYEEWADANKIEADRVRKDLGILIGEDNLRHAYQYFNRYNQSYHDNEMRPLIQYVFMVRPDLNILNEVDMNVPSETCINDSFINLMVQDNNICCRQLVGDSFYGHDWMPMMVGRVESLQIPDYTLKDYQISQPYTNYLMPYAGSAIDSQTGGSFDIVFKEDNTLRVVKTFQTWCYYIDKLTRNQFKPKDKYITYNKFDYMSSVYHIICDVDGTTVLYWSKYTGCFPTSVPISNLSFNLGGNIDNKISIPFRYFIHEALNPDIIMDFNRNSGMHPQWSYSYWKSICKKYEYGGYNMEESIPNLRYAGKPFIVREGWKIKLRWLKTDADAMPNQLKISLV